MKDIMKKLFLTVCVLTLGATVIFYAGNSSKEEKPVLDSETAVVESEEAEQLKAEEKQDDLVLDLLETKYEKTEAPAKAEKK